MKYKDENGVLQNIELVSGTEGAGEENHMKLVIPHDKEILDTTDKTYGPGDVSIEFYELDAEGNPGAGAGLLISKDKNEFPDDCGSIQVRISVIISCLAVPCRQVWICCGKAEIPVMTSGDTITI